VLNLDVSTTGGVSDRLIIDHGLTADKGSFINLSLTDNAGTSADDFSKINIANLFTFVGGATPANTFSNIEFIAQGTAAGATKYVLSVNDNGSIGSITPVPEPEVYTMLLAGLGMLGAAFRRRCKATAV